MGVNIKELESETTTTIEENALKTVSPKVLLNPLITANKTTSVSAYLVRVLYMNTKPKFLKIMIENKKFSKSFTFVLQ